MKPSGTWFLEQTWSRGLGVDVKKWTRQPWGRGRALPLVGPSWLSQPTSSSYICSHTPKTSRSTTKPYFHRRNLLYPWDPILGLFRCFVGGGIDHGGLLHQHHSLSNDVWVVYHRPSGPYLLARWLLLSFWISIQSSLRSSWRSIRCNSFCGVFVEIRWIVGLWSSLSMRNIWISSEFFYVWYLSLQVSLNYQFGLAY